MAGSVTESTKEATLRGVAAERILVLDGAMGTMIQALSLDEEGYRGARFDAWNREVRGNNDLLNLTRPDAIRAIHLAYFRAGADIVSTNTFSSTRVAQSDYAMAEIAYELNLEGARLARQAADFAQTKNFAARAGASVPDWLAARFAGLEDDPATRKLIAAAAAAEQVRDLVDHGVTDFHFYTMNRADLVYAICHLLGLRPAALPLPAGERVGVREPL